MARIEHIAIASQEPEKQAEFYKEAFGFDEVSRLENPRCRGVVLTDGHINISILKFKQDQLGHGLDFSGLHHFGVRLDDLEGTAKKCLDNGYTPISDLPIEAEELKNYYRSKKADKFIGPEKDLFDIATESWRGVPKQAAE
jgi:glyoxylase I family protein